VLRGVWCGLFFLSRRVELAGVVLLALASIFALTLISHCSGYFSVVFIQNVRHSDNYRLNSL